MNKRPRKKCTHEWIAVAPPYKGGHCTDCGKGFVPLPPLIVVTEE